MRTLLGTRGSWHAPGPYDHTDTRTRRSSIPHAARPSITAPNVVRPQGACHRRSFRASGLVTKQSARVVRLRRRLQSVAERRVQVLAIASEPLSAAPTEMRGADVVLRVGASQKWCK